MKLIPTANIHLDTSLTFWEIFIIRFLVESWMRGLIPLSICQFYIFVFVWIKQTRYNVSINTFYEVLVGGFLKKTLGRARLTVSHASSL